MSRGFVVPSKKDRREDLLKITKQLETQGQEDPINTVHPLGRGMSEHAYGSYGLMPGTLREFANRERLATHGTEPRLPVRRDMSEEEIQGLLKDNEELQKIYAGQVIDHILRRNPNISDEELQYMYKYGHNAKQENLDPDKINTDERTVRFNKIRGLLGSQ